MEGTIKTDQSSRRMGFLILLAGLFFISVAGAWFWVWRGQPAQAEALWFQARTQLEGYPFTPDELDPGTLAKLGTTNVVNGRFTHASHFESAVFLASWTGAKGQKISAVEHTPDVCWAHEGLRPVELGQPPQVNLAFEGRAMPFECRVFESPGGTRRELVVWCSLLGGQVMPELDVLRLSPKDSTDRYSDHGSRSVTVRQRLKIAQFIGLITHRLPAQGSRQFVRFSLPLTTDWRDGLQQIATFGPQWLGLTRTVVNGRSR
jgi:hypothetical protein